MIKRFNDMDDSINELFGASETGDKILKVMGESKNERKHDKYAKMIWSSVKDGLFKLNVMEPGHQKTEFEVTSPLDGKKSLNVIIRVSPLQQNHIQYHILSVNGKDLDVSDNIMNAILSELDKNTNIEQENHDEIDQIFNGF